jgi:hypothetical protein
MQPKYQINDEIYWLYLDRKIVNLYAVRITDIHIGEKDGAPSIHYRFSMILDPQPWPNCAVGYHDEDFFCRTIGEAKDVLVNMLKIVGRTNETSN